MFRGHTPHRTVNFAPFEEDIDTAATMARKRYTRPHRPSTTPPDPRPYTYDPKLEVNLYCGTGYERFPVVLGSVKGHTELCEAWDARQKVRDQLSSGEMFEFIDLHNSSDAVEPSVKTVEQEQNEQQFVASVLQVFPQISRKYVWKLYSKRLVSRLDDHDHMVFEFPDAGEIIANIAEMESYPKQIDEDRQEKEAEELDETGATIEFNKNTFKDMVYRREAVILLARFFDHVPTHHIYKTYNENLSVFETYVSLTTSEANYYTLVPRPYSRSRAPRTQLEKKYFLHRLDRRDPHSYIELVNEFQAARQHVERERLKAEAVERFEAVEADNLANQKAEGAIVQCKCCFEDEIPLNRAVGCGGAEVHFFCFSCVRQLANTQVGMMKHEMACMDESGCSVPLSIEGIGKAVTIKIVDKLAFYQQQAEIMAANIEGLEQCPFCEFKAICEPIEVETVFFCQNPDCGRPSCRKCHENTHLPRTCQEAKADRGLSARHQVEEARSEAMMRPCPKCGVKIVKEYGCNKMICTKCGCLICYVCKQDISSGREGGYEHFNRVGSKCKLYDNEGPDRHQEEADEAEREAIKRVRTENQDVEEDTLRVDLDKDGNRRDGGHQANPRPRGPDFLQFLHQHHHFHFNNPIYDPNFAAGRAPYFPPAYGQYMPGMGPAARPMPAPAPAARHPMAEAMLRQMRARAAGGRNVTEEFEGLLPARPGPPPAHGGPQQLRAPGVNDNVVQPPQPKERPPPYDYPDRLAAARTAREADRQRRNAEARDRARHMARELAREQTRDVAMRRADLDLRRIQRPIMERLDALNRMQAENDARNTRPRGGGGEPDPIIISDDNDEDLDLLVWEEDALTGWSANEKLTDPPAANAVEATTAGANTRIANSMASTVVMRPMLAALEIDGHRDFVKQQPRGNSNLQPQYPYEEYDWGMDVDEPDTEPQLPSTLQPKLPGSQRAFDTYEADRQYDVSHSGHGLRKKPQPHDPYSHPTTANGVQYPYAVFGDPLDWASEVTKNRQPIAFGRSGLHTAAFNQDPIPAEGPIRGFDHFEDMRGVDPDWQFPEPFQLLPVPTANSAFFDTSNIPLAPTYPPASVMPTDGPYGTGVGAKSSVVGAKDTVMATPNIDLRTGAVGAKNQGSSAAGFTPPARWWVPQKDDDFYM